MTDLRRLALSHLRSIKRLEGRYNAEGEILFHALAALDAMERDARSEDSTARVELPKEGR